MCCIKQHVAFLIIALLKQVNAVHNPGKIIKLEKSGGFVSAKWDGLGIACSLAQGHVGCVGFAFAIVGHGFNYCALEGLDWAGIGGAEVHSHIITSQKASK